MSDDKLWDNEPDTFTRVKKEFPTKEAEALIEDLAGWVCPPPVYDLLKLIVEYLKPEEEL